MTEKKDTRLERWLGNVLPFAPVAIAVFWLARATTRNILTKAGEPAVPLDDAYIHLQYARSLAEGRFYAFVPGEGYTSGATSLLWPAALAPFYLFGLRDSAIVWSAWGLGWLFLTLLAIETKRLAAPLVGEASAIGAAASVVCFGGYTWFAASGMEVTPLAYTLALTARLAATWGEATDARTPALRNKLLLLATLGPLVRPEGMVASLAVIVTLVVFPPSGGARLARLWSLAALVGPLVPPLLNKMLTGHFSSSTTQVKWLPGNPYYGGDHLWGSIRANLEIFRSTLLDGREWSAIFIPAGAYPVAIATLCAIPIAGLRAKRPYRMLLILGLAIGMALPTTYLSFLWNRLRYLWPFAFAWCIGMACLARVVGDLLSLIRPRFALAAPVLTGIGAGLLGHQLSWTIDDVAQSSYAITSQQVKLGRWAKEHLPANARIGVNDTGAVAYFSDRKVFDVVGLTTPREARYWVAGAGSRFEHYERLSRETTNVLPTHFIVYPHWMACDAVLGRELTRATVLDQTILGGATMIAYEARWDRLHTGERPLSPFPPVFVDEIDVSDLESEALHGFDAIGGGGTDTDNRVRTLERFGKEHVVDGGRERRTVDRFTLDVPQGKPTYLVGRFSSQLGAVLDVRVGALVVGQLKVPATSWVELAVPVPAGGSGRTPFVVTSRDGRIFGSLHYWLIEGTPPPVSEVEPPFPGEDVSDD